MIESTLCYLERGEQYLMLHRIKKARDVNHDKWIGVGGKLEPGETPEECILRETFEETGLTLTEYRYRGILYFTASEQPGLEADMIDSEKIYLYTASNWTGSPKLSDCQEGELAWIAKKELLRLPMWEGDEIFLRLLEEDAPFFELTLDYVRDHLIHAALNGEELSV